MSPLGALPMLKFILVAVLAVTSAIGWAVSRPANHTPQASQGASGGLAEGFQPVGGPAFAQTPPPGFPASFNVTYNGPDGAFATVCYYTGQVGEVMRWTSVLVQTAEMRGPVEITFHAVIKSWRADVGNVTNGNNTAPVGGRMWRFGKTTAEPANVFLGYLTIN